MNTNKVIRTITGILVPVDLVLMFLYNSDQEKYASLFFIVGFITLALMTISMLTDKRLVNPFKESPDGTYSIKDQISLSIFFIIALIFITPLLYWAFFLSEIGWLHYLVPVFFVIGVSIFGYNIHRLTKLKK